ncbi:hypothetical protein [Martelella mediterranea]|nr:hypothetical protein [Martelella mediterranea]
MSKRSTYRPEQAEALAKIERRRQIMDVQHSELADTAAISRETWRRIRREKRAFPAQITALRFALRTIEARRRSAEDVFPDPDNGEQP